MMSLMASSVLCFFSRDVLDEIWDVIESVSEVFHTYSRIVNQMNSKQHVLSKH